MREGEILVIARAVRKGHFIWLLEVGVSAVCDVSLSHPISNQDGQDVKMDQQPFVNDAVAIMLRG